MRVYITGVDGFIGQHVADALAKAGHDVRGCDVGHEDAITAPNVVFHAAATARTGESFDHPARVYENNVMATLRWLEIARAHKSRFVNASSVVVQHPTSSPYAASKAASANLVDAWVSCYGVDAFNVPIASVFGEGQSTEGDAPNVLAAMRRDCEQYGHVRVEGDGSQTRDFIHIDDAVEKLARIVSGEAAFSPVGSGYQSKIIDVARMFDCPIVFLPRRPNDPHELKSHAWPPSDPTEKLLEYARRSRPHRQR